MKYFYLLIVFFISLFPLVVYAQNSWEFCGLENETITNLYSDSSGLLFASTLNDCLFKSSNRGNNWEKSENGITSNYIWSVSAIGKNLCCCTVDSGLFKSSDKGVRWSPAGLNEWVSQLACNDFGDIFAATISGGIFRSTNTGISWEKISDNFIGKDVYSIYITSENNIFAGTDAHIFQSTNSGDTWFESDSGVTVTGVIWSIISNLTGNIFVGDGGGFFTGPGKIYKTSNDGLSWVPTSITNRSCNALLSVGQYIYAATDSGVFMSDDNGDTGVLLNNGLNNLNVKALMLDQEGFLFVGTADGVFCSSKSLTSVKESTRELARVFALFQNYPNPFNPTTNFEFRISHIESL